MRSTGHDQQRPRTFLQRLHIDLPLLSGILALMALGLFVVYSAGGQESAVLIRHAKRVGLALLAMFIVAQIPPLSYRKWAVPVFLSLIHI